MTQLLIARRNAVLRDAEGNLERVVRGITLAYADHPIAAAHPDAFQPVKVHLDVEAADPGHLEDDFTELLAEVEAERDAYREQLAAIVDKMDERGVIGADVDRTREGWLVEVLADVLPLAIATPDPVAPPRAPRKAAKTAAPKAAGDGS